ncbi:MAG: 3-dehydroquinate synthase [Verrucomicrobia bacterium]|nr:3-dehydroquinate synthase [Verrucomicrobiota bacterium]
MKYALITDHLVKELYGKTLLEHLKAQGHDIQLFSFPAGEPSKTRATKQQLEDALLSQGYGRDTTLLALGGGVVTDLVGFLASTFCRGVHLILIPTTLLAMVDAAIGGKTGVNTELGKNMIGTFYFPQSLLIHPGFLKTLPEEEMFNGKVEMLKAGLIADAGFFQAFEKIPLENAIARAIEIKRRIVALDPHEKGLRRTLNCGHTIGHAVETLSRYTISHGRAVAAGIVLESRMAYEMGLLKKESLEQIEERFPPVSIAFSPEEILNILRTDKKSSHGYPRFVLLQEIGIPLACAGEYCIEVPLEILTQVLHDAAMCAC